MIFNKSAVPRTILGKKPAFQEKLHVGRPNLGDRQRLLARVAAILDRSRLTNDGPFLKEFEQRICEALGMRHCVTMCNATIVLIIAIRTAVN